MAATANLKSKISLDSTEFKAGIRRVKLTAAAASRSIGKGFRSMGAGLGKVAGMMAGLAKSLAKFGAIVGAITFGAAIAGAVVLSKVLRGAISEAASYEQIKVTMTAFLKDADKARDTLAEINDFSVVTPFETKGLQEATNKMLGAGIAGDQVVDVLKEISAVSKSTEQVGELADALSKGFAKGKFQTEELNKFLERGINLMPELARVTGKTGEELQKAVQKGLKFDDVRSALAAMSAEGGLFFGVLGKQSTTFNGLISTLISNWQAFQTQLGKPINDALKPLLIFATTKIQEMTAGAESFGAAIGERIANFTKLIEGIDFVGVGKRFIAGFNIANLKNLLISAFTVAGAYLGNQLIKAAIVSAEYMEILWTDKGTKIAQKIGAALKDAATTYVRTLLNPSQAIGVIAKGASAIGGAASDAGEAGASLSQKLEDGITSVLEKYDRNGDVFGIGKATERLDEVLKNWGKEQNSNAAVQSDILEKQNQAKAKEGQRVADDARRKKLESTFELSDAAKKQAESRAKRAKRESDFDKGVGAKHATLPKSFEAFGPPSSLANKLPSLTGKFGSAFGSNGAKGGLRTGGLGDVRRVGQKGREAAAKKEDSLVSTNEHLTTQNGLMQEQIALLREGLGV
tara:strand:- start:20554 stop:22449 length:1896 start_codon:yes stop_codon:yes gene_type:complete